MGAGARGQADADDLVASQRSRSERRINLDGTVLVGIWGDRSSDLTIRLRHRLDRILVRIVVRCDSSSYRYIDV